MPALGLGTYSIDNPEIIVDAITKFGYRHLDTASHYKNLEIVGEGLARAVEQVDRSSLFITAKCWVDDTEDCEAALKSTL
jgi:diketogulonate reductase-like aldo/keto reductase